MGVRSDIMTEAELEALSRQGASKSYDSHAVIVREGDETDSLYVLLSGRVKVYVTDEAGREVVLTTQGPGQYFGEMALDGGKRSASVMTLEPCRLLVVPRRRVRAFLRSQPGFAVRLIEKLIRRNRHLITSVKDLALMDVYGRVARLLIEHADVEDGRLVIKDRMSEAEMASRVGTTHEMVGRVLDDLAAGGYISIKRKRITINKARPRHW